MERTEGAFAQKPEYCLPLDIPEIIDNDAVISFVKAFRNAEPRSCPRCQSEFTKHINASSTEDLNRCIDCGYMFKSFSGSIFQGTKLPFAKLVQAMIIVDSDIQDSNLRDMSYALDVSYKTALGIQRKIQSYPNSDHYISYDGDYSGFDIHSPSGVQKFAYFCAVHKINLHRDQFYRRLESMLTISK